MANGIRERVVAAVVAAALGGAAVVMVVASGERASAPLRAAAALEPRPPAHALSPATAAFGAEAPLERASAPAALPDNPSAKPVRANIAALMEDLRDDAVRFNACRAVSELINLPAGSMPELERALRADDLQLRHFAAIVLRARVASSRAEASARLLEVTVDVLASDICDRVPGLLRLSGASPEPWAARFLAERARAAKGALERGLRGSDPQQRFLCGYLLAQAGLKEHAVQIAYELIGHLNDNDITGDAMMAAHGLFRLGPVVEPVLLDNWRHVDQQGRDLIRLIRLDYERPPQDKEELRRRGGIAKVSSLYHDVAIEFDLSRSTVPRFRR